MHDKERGPITYVRVYSGSLKNRAYLTISNNNQKQRIQQLLRLRADEASSKKNVFTNYF
jgi:elongation factor G